MAAEQRATGNGPEAMSRPRRRRRAVRALAAMLTALAVAGVMLAGIHSPLLARHGDAQDATRFSARLSGFQEVPANVTTGSARLELNLVAANKLTFTLMYTGLTGNPAAAHIHIGQRGVNGGVTIFFCGGGGKPACPASTSGTVSGTISPADVLALPGQGLAAGDLASVLRAMRAGVTYANMHTAQFPAGEIRGQIRPDSGEAGSGEQDGQ